MKYLFLFTISPVQSFIEQARKTQDLFAGSRILSDLIDKAMEVVKNESSNFEFIFPSISVVSKPNRFIAIVEPKDDIQSFGNSIKNRVVKYFIEELGEGVINLQPDSREQMEDFLKIYWVATEKNDSPYADQIKNIERDLGATKNIRYFNQIAEKGRKCSINGEYNVKFYRKTKDESKNNIKVLGNKKKLFHTSAKVIEYRGKELTISHLQQGEGLCGVSMLKRFYGKSNTKEFESTANIALMATLYKIDKEEIGKNLLNGFALSVGEKSYWQEILNGQLFYEENLTESYFKKQDLPKAGLKVAAEKLSKIEKMVKEKGLLLSKYYAILVFDADGMGKQLQKCKTKEEHKQISNLLAEFADYAQKYIDNNLYGRTVYAGGDDFLGFLNLNDLFKVMKTLREEFNRVVNINLEDHLKLTFSAGVAIGHYKTPLSEVLNWARRMEKKAKKVKLKNNDTIKKDAFAVAVLKHSGEIHDTVWRWTDDQGNWSSDILDRLITHLNAGDISTKFINNLSIEYGKVLDEDGGWGEKAAQMQEDMQLNEILKDDLAYFANRAASDDFKDQVKSLSTSLSTLYVHHYDFEIYLKNFLNMLHICDFISRQINKRQNTKQELTEATI